MNDKKELTATALVLGVLLAVVFGHFNEPIVSDELKFDVRCEA